MAATVSSSVSDLARAAKAASRKLATVPSATKDAALNAIADALEARRPRSSRRTRAISRPAARRALRRADGPAGAGHSARAGDADGARAIAALPDPVGEVVDGGRLANGLEFRKVRVPFGVIAVVYEARPNVTIDAAALCLKSGNAVLLRGSSSAAHSNEVLARVRALSQRPIALGQTQWGQHPEGNRIL